jgi:hypothetical protein
MTETSPPPFADAHQAIGEYFCEFSRVEQELGESIKVVYGLQDNEASAAIVAELGDISKKASIVLAASNGAKNADGSDASVEWKAQVDAAINNVFRSNDDRVRLAHSLLQPKADGSVDLVRLRINRGKVTGRDGVTWSSDAFGAKIQRLKKLAEELKSLNSELQNFQYTIQNLDWFPSHVFTQTNPTALSVATLKLTPVAEDLK